MTNTELTMQRLMRGTKTNSPATIRAILDAMHVEINAQALEAAEWGEHERREALVEIGNHIEKLSIGIGARFGHIPRI